MLLATKQEDVGPSPLNLVAVVSQQIHVRGPLDK